MYDVSTLAHELLCSSLAELLVPPRIVAWGKGSTGLPNGIPAAEYVNCGASLFCVVVCASKPTIHEARYASEWLSTEGSELL